LSGAKDILLKFPKICPKNFYAESLAYVAVGYLSTGSDTEGGDWGDRPPKTSESNLIHHAFVQP